LFLAQSKLRHFEEKYSTTLEQLEQRGLADDADFRMHEDYLMWHHWADVAARTKKDIALLEPLAAQGIPGGTSGNVGD